jgi:carbamoyl-phosphate synthase small subunit
LGVETKEKLKARLILEDGTVFNGHGFGFPDRVVGEIVFNTGMVGYTESLTDPSYRGQMLCFTYPLIGNYGVPDLGKRDRFGLPIGFESESIQASALIVQEVCKEPSHWSSITTLDNWLEKERIPAIHGIDTRNLTKKLRVHGVMMSVLEVSESPSSKEVLLDYLRSQKSYSEINFVNNVSIDHEVEYGVGQKRVVVIDCGVKISIIREIIDRGYKVIRVPFNSPIEKILSFNPDGVIISNGPGDPKLCNETISSTRDLFKKKIPLLGICLGTQIIALALGGDTFKLKYGHRGQNKPCSDEFHSYVTSQNHGFSVNPESLENTGLETWFTNSDDKTLEGMRHKNGRCLSVQFHPEASPGPYDTGYVFDEFCKIMEAKSTE